MRMRMDDLREALTEGVPFGGWYVKPGQLLVRGVDEPPSAWRWEEFPKRLYFKEDELVNAPGGPTARQVWTFKRDGMLYSIAEYDFYDAPKTNWDHVFDK